MSGSSNNKRNLKVFHGFSNYAGQPSLISDYLNKHGTRAFFLEYSKNKFYPAPTVNLKKIPGRFRGLARELVFKFALRYDIIHFHGINTFTSDFEGDLKKLKNKGKKIVFQFWGSDIRQLDIAKKYPYHYANFLEIDEKREEKKRQRYNILESYADLVLSIYDLLEYTPGGIHTYQFWDKEASKTLNPSFSSDGKIRILHAPTERNIKGTEEVIRAVEKIKEKNSNVVLDLIENLSHEKLLEIMARSDIIIDQLRLGAYGIFATEAMGLGKPTVCYIRPDVANMYPVKLPLVNANPDTIEEVLEYLIRNKDRLPGIGQESKKFVEEFHDPDKNAEILIEHYKKL